ncbi:tRNA lysidine(34) synthetase TilS [Chloroflexota bacterium]
MVRKQGYQELLEQRVLHFIQEHSLVSGQLQLPVAVSGGPDSVCLLHILVRLREELDVKLHVAHLDHKLRGVESEADARYVSQLAHQLGIPATIEARDVKDYQARQRISLEEAAREVRYTFLAEVAKSVGANCVAVGHTTDDHIETILMHLIRGTGTRGLRGLQPDSRWQSSESSLMIIRPLLQVNRQETADYCYRYELEPRIDASNLLLSPLRNRIRHQLLPILKSYNPRVAKALLRTAHIVGDDLAVLDKEVARLWGSIARKQGDIVVLDKEKFLEIPPALQRYLLRSAIEGILGNLKDIEARHIEEIMAALSKPAGKRLNLPRGLVFIIEYNRYLLATETVALSPFPVISNEFVLKIPGETLFPSWCVKATVIKREQMEDKENDFTAYLDLDKVGDRTVVRCRQAGDRFQPLGMNQPKKLGEYMIDAKIPRAWRQQIPVVCSPERILWVVGWRIDDRAKVTENTEQVLRLEFERTSDTVA